MFSILDAIAAVDLELCMKELDELIKSEEKTENAKEDEKNDNENKIIIDEGPNPTKEKEEKVKDIKEQLKHRARLLGFSCSNAFCDVIDKISTEPIDQFKNFVKNCQDKFDKYQKDYGSTSMMSSLTKNEEEKKLLIEAVRKAEKLGLDIVKYFYDEAKKQAKEILKQKKKDEKNKDNPKILAVEFVLDLMDNMDNKNLNTEISKELRFLANGTKQLDEKDDFGFENLQSIIKSISSTQNLPNGKLFDSDSVKKFYNLLSKTDNKYSKGILNAIDKPQVDIFLDNILNRENGKLVSDFFAFAFDDKQDANRKLVYVKKFYLTILDQVFVNFENEFEGYKFLSLVFKPYFDKKISGANTIEKLEPIIESVRSFQNDFCLSTDFETSLNLLINNVDKIKDKNALKAFFDSYSWSFDDIQNDDAKQYENRKLLVDLKDIFLDDVMHQFKNEDATTHIESVAKLLTKLDNETDSKKYGLNDFFGLGEVLYTYEQRSIRDKINKKFPLLEATLAFQAHYGFAKLDTNEKQNLFKRLVNIKKNGLQGQDKEDLKNYFWSHATEIFKWERKFTKAQAKEFYGFIKDEGNGNNQYFKLLDSAIDTLGLSTQKYLVEILNQDDNFKNIILLKNGEGEEKEKAYKSILKSLVKQRLNQKGGFVSSAYIKYYEKQIDNNEITDESHNGIVSGVNEVLNDDFQPEIEILTKAINDLNSKNDLSDFWKSCRMADKNQAEKKEGNKLINEQFMVGQEEKHDKPNKLIINTSDNKNEKKDISNNEKILDALSYIFIDLLKHDNKSSGDEENKVEINTDISKQIPNKFITDNKLDLVNITKEFVSSLYKANEDDKKEENIHINTEKDKEINEQPEKDNTGITEVLKKYYDTIGEHRLSKNSLGSFGAQVLLDQIKNFHKLDGDSKIKLLQCMKNVKDICVTNDDLVYINLCCYKMHRSNKLEINDRTSLLSCFKLSNNDICTSVLHQTFIVYGNDMTGDQIESVIKNISKEKIDNPAEKKKFAGAVISVLEQQIKCLQSKYDSNDYGTIDFTMPQCKEKWKDLINELKGKNLITGRQCTEINNQINAAYELGITGGLAAIGQWILSALAAIFLIPLANNTIRKTLHSPLQARRTRHLIKSAQDNNNGIFSNIRQIASNNLDIPLSIHSEEQNKE